MELEITTTALKKAVKVVVVVALLIALYFAGKWAWPQVSALLPAPAATLTPTPAPDLAMQAAVEGVEARYTFDAQHGVQAWVDKMCGIVGEDNCVLYQGLIGPGLEELFKKYPDLNNTATVLSAELVDEQTDKDGNLNRVYRVRVRMSDPWPEFEAKYGNPAVLYAHVVRVNGRWQFTHVLFDQEAKYYEATPAPTAQP